MEDLKSMALTTEGQKQHRTALRYLCYHILGVKILDHTQKDISIRIGFRDEVFKVGCPLTHLFLFKVNLFPLLNRTSRKRQQSSFYSRQTQLLCVTIGLTMPSSVT